MAAPGRRFAFLLARTLGRTVEELENSMTAQEFGEWFAVWRWGAWAPLPEAPNETEATPMDPMNFAAIVK